MQRRIFLQKTTEELGVLGGWPRASEGMGTASPAAGQASIFLDGYCILAGGWDEALVNDPRYAPYLLQDAEGKPGGERRTA